MSLSVEKRSNYFISMHKGILRASLLFLWEDALIESASLKTHWEKALIHYLDMVSVYWHWYQFFDTELDCENVEWCNSNNIQLFSLRCDEFALNQFALNFKLLPCPEITAASSCSGVERREGIATCKMERKLANSRFNLNRYRCW